MKKIVKLILFLIVFTFPIKVMGYCTTEYKMRYSTLASNITTSYDYVENNDSVSFSVTIHNVHKDLIVVDRQTGKKYSNKQNDLNNFTISNLKDGQSFAYEVYADNSDCLYRIYNTLYVTVPKYNKYYKESVCNGAEDYLYCQKWAQIGSVTYDEFVELVTDHKQKEVEEIIEKNEEEISLIYIIGDFWAKYYLYITIGTIIVCMPIIIIKNKRDSFDF